MASIKKIDPPVEPVYQLTLSKIEAEVLKTICGAIIGDPCRSARKVSENIFNQLDSVGINIWSNSNCGGYWKNGSSPFPKNCSRNFQG